jgi:GABA permease
LRLRSKFEAEAPEKLQVKMWFHPYGTYAAIAGMLGVLALMATSKTQAIEFWASILVTALFLAGYWVKTNVDRSSNRN